MLKKFVSLLILTLFMFSFMAVTAGAKSRIKDERSEKQSHYGFMYGKKLMPIPRQSSPVMVKDDYRVSLGTSGDGNSPGAIVAHTWYEMQQPSSMGRQIDWRQPNPQIHMGYTQMFAVGGRRYASYNVYDPVSGTWPLTADVGCAVSPWGFGMASGASLDVRPDGGSVVACHYRTTEGELDDYNTTVYIDQTAGSGLYCGFGSGSSAPNDSASAAMEPPPEYIWPKLEYHINGSDTVIYALSWEMVEYNLGTLVLFRNVGSNLQGSWETHIIDTIFYPNHAIASSRVSTKVACCWLEEAAEGVEGNNDVWYLVSYDMGATWNPYYKVNVTNYNPYEPGFRAWIELSCLYDSKDDLHIVWNASVYNGDGTEADSRSCRLFHWTENTDLISTIHDATWDPMLNCGMGGPNVLNIGHISISVCDSLGLDDRLYVIWSQWGDPEKGDSTDCADPIFVGFEKGANADIYMSQSNLDGLAWEVPYNLTKTKTPGCDTTTGNECDNETWSSMSRYCMDNRDWSGLDWSSASEALTVNPRPDQPEKWLFLDVFYVNDVAPGLSELVDSRSENAVNYNVPLKWFRLPYVYRKVESRMHLSPRKLNYPSYIRHGEQTKYYVTIENIGDSDLVLSDIYIEKVTYEDVDWLGIDQINMTISWGPPDNIDTLIVTVNKDGIIYSPGTIVNLVGRVALKRVIGDYGSYDTTYLPVDIMVADTVVDIIWDTISTLKTDLVVSSNGNMGKSNDGFVNMDFANNYYSFECDDSSNYNNRSLDTIPGNAAVYLYSASPVILSAQIEGPDTHVTASWAIFNEELESPNTFKPVTGETPSGVKLSKPDDYFFHHDSLTGHLSYEAFHTGSFVTVDSHLVVEKTYYAPIGETYSQLYSSIVSLMRIFSYDGQAHSGLIIGEAFDWDIPSDSGVYNFSGVIPNLDLIYMQGGNWTEPHGDSLQCVNNCTRTAGAIRVGYYTQAEYNANPVMAHTEPIWGGYAELNETYVYPRKVQSDFEGDYYYKKEGFLPIELYRNMVNNSGLNAQPSSVIKDQHIVLTYFNNYTLKATDSLLIWTLMVSKPPIMKDIIYSTEIYDSLFYEINRGRSWLIASLSSLKTNFKSHYCIGMTGNADCSASEDPDISDITRLISFLYLQGAELCCVAEADVDNSGGSVPTVGDVDISDITYLIAHLYLDHRALKPCP